MKQTIISFFSILVLSFCFGTNTVGAQDQLIQWKFQMGEAYHASPVHHDNTIFIGGMDGYLYAIVDILPSLK